MPTNYGIREHDRNFWAAKYRSGSTLLVIGWILIGWAAMTGIFIFNSVDIGSGTWVWSTVALTLVGLLLIGAGMRMRRQRPTEVPIQLRRPDKVA